MQQVALHSAIYKELFEELPEDERMEWAERAAREHQEALQKIEGNLKSGPSTDPADLQWIIECLPRFVPPLLNLIVEYTGWKVLLITGGPEPVNGDCLYMMNLHAGVTPGMIKMDFGHSERVVYKDIIVPAFGRFLRKCYYAIAIQECRERGLADKGDFKRLAGLDFEQMEIHTINRHDEDEPIRGVAPRHQLPSVVNKETTSGKEKGKAPALRALPTVIDDPLSVKIGPPKPNKDMPASYDVGVGGTRSRGPTPLISRPATLIPDLMGESSILTAPPIAEAASTSASLIAKGTTASAPPITELTSPTALPVAAGIQISMTVTPPHPGPSTSDAMCIDEGPITVQMDGPSASLSLTSALPVHSISPATASSTAPPLNLASSATHLGAMHELRDHDMVAPSNLNPSESALSLLKRNIVTTSLGSIAVPNLQSITHAESKSKQRKQKGTIGALVKPDAKKRHISDQGSSSSAQRPSELSSIKAPRNVLTWVVNALELFQTTDLGDKWVLLVQAWLKFEQNAKFKANGCLGTQHHPSHVHDWIQCARLASFHPEIEDLKTYATDFSAWWQSLQPYWRTSDNVNRDIPRAHEDWGDIWRAGINGLLSVTAALFFWGNATHSQTSSVKSAWLNALDDVIYMLDQLA